MKVAATADLHGHLPEIPDCDLLVVAGDVCPVDDHGLPRQREWLTREFLPWLDQSPAGEIVWVAGNHDFALELGAERLRSRAHYLQDSLIELSIGGEPVKIYGTPWTREIGPWAFSLPEKQDGRRPGLEDVFSRIDPRTDILVSHGPPRGILDRTLGGEYVGSPSLRARIRAVAPRLVVFGHIHEAHGRITLQGTTYLNAAHMDARYRPVNPVEEFELR